jgi:hypothetical protein
VSYVLNLQALAAAPNADRDWPTFTSYVSTIFCPASFGCARSATTR